MEEDPPPGDFVPPGVAYNVTIEGDESQKHMEKVLSAYENDSSMDTDHADAITTTKRKRVRPTKICKHCNKKRRKHPHATKVSCTCVNEDLEVQNESSVVDFTNGTGPNISHVTPQNPESKTIISPPTTQSTTKIGRSEYTANDIAPYVVHVQRDSTDAGATFHPISFGNFLKKNNIQNICNGSIKKIGRNRITVAFTSYMAANSFITNNKLVDFKLKAFIPSYNITRMGLVRGVPADWDLDEIKENISVPVGCGEIIKTRRLNYKVMVDGSPTWKPSQTVVLTFDGQVLPKRVFMCYNSLPVELYTYPTIQCYNCCRYGHTKNQCRSKPRCYKCGFSHTGSSCDVEEDSASCCMCSGYHYATNKTCPEFERQKQIKTYMAQNCVSYVEAAKLHPPVHRPYASVVSQPSHQSVAHDDQPITTAMTTHTPTTSYRKTVLLKPRALPRFSRGYDRAAHQEILGDYNNEKSLGNGSVLKSSDNDEMQSSILEIITALIKLLTSSNFSPSHVAPLLDIISSINKNNNGSIRQNTAVERSQYSQ